MSISTDLTGKTYGRLTVIERYGSINGRVHWSCQCICGRTIRVPSSNLNNGNSTSCGCQRTDSIKALCTTHGLMGAPEYQVWAGMKARCNYTKHKDYASYGGRGIKVCKRWSDSFADFYADMGKRPTSAHSIERRNVNDGYSPDNCYWATIDVQSANRRNNRRFTYQGKEMTLRQAAAASGVDYDKLKYRLNLNYSADEAVAMLQR